MKDEVIKSGVYLIGQQSTRESAIKIGMASQNLEARLKQYNTYNPFHNIIDKKHVAKNMVKQVEDEYHKQLIQIGELKSNTKEWFIVSNDIYNQILEKGFNYFDMENEVVIQLFSDKIYMTKDIKDIAKKTAGPNNDFDKISSDAFNGRIVSAIFEKSGRNGELLAIADEIQQKSLTGKYCPEGEAKQHKNKFTAFQIEKIMNNPTFNLTGWDKRVVIRFEIIDKGTALEADQPIQKVVDPPMTTFTTPKLDLSAYKYHEDKSIKKCKDDVVALQNFIIAAQNLIDEYNGIVVFK